MHVMIGGKRYEVVLCRLPKDRCGECDSPNVKGKQIRISNKLRGKDLVECAIHEALHAQGWHLDEEFVDRAGREITNLLDKLGLISS